MAQQFLAIRAERCVFTVKYEMQSFVFDGENTLAAVRVILSTENKDEISYDP